MKKALVLLATMDYALTLILLSKEGYYECNPATAELIRQFGLFPGLSIHWFYVVIFLIVIVGTLNYVHKRLAQLATLIYGTQIGLAVISNIAMTFHITWFPYALVQRILGY